MMLRLQSYSGRALCFLSIILHSHMANYRLHSEYTIEEFLQVDFPNIYKVVTKAELLNYMLKRFVHSNLKHARYSHFKHKALMRKVQYYEEKEGQPQISEEELQKFTKKETMEEIESGKGKGEKSYRSYLV